MTQTSTQRPDSIGGKTMERPYFRMGAYGMLIIGNSIPLYFALDILWWLGLLPFTLGSITTAFWFGLAISIYIGFLLAGIGFFGYYRIYGLTWGYTAALVLIVMGWMFLCSDVYQFVLNFLNPVYLTLMLFLIFVIPSWLRYPPTAILFFFILKLAYLGFAPILSGVVVYKAVPFSDSRHLSLIAAVLLIGAGLAFLPIIILHLLGFPLELQFLVIIAGTALLCIASVLTSMVFSRAQTSKLKSLA
jgi:hypothetical protein